MRIDGLNKAQLAARTGKKNGAKFLPGITLEHIVRYTAEILTENNAVLNTSGTYTKTFADPVGIASGLQVNTIQVLCDGRYAHAFPVAP